MNIGGTELGHHHAAWLGTRVAVTGATGTVGGLVADLLRAVGATPRLIVRDPAKLRRSTRDVRVCDYGDRAAAARALDGIHVLFMVSASESPERLGSHRAFIESATEAGVEHVVYTSFLGASPDAVFTLARDHAETEQMIIQSGLVHTFLRDNLYSDFLPRMIDRAAIRGPARSGGLASVAQADVARVAASVLMDPMAHEGAPTT